MTIEEYADLARSFGLYPIHVESVPGHGDMSFIGTLAEYFQAVKAMGTMTVFVSTIDLSEDLFIYQKIDEDDDDDDKDQDSDSSMMKRK